MRVISHPEVYLDDELVKSCLRADVLGGYVVALELDENGEVVLEPRQFLRRAVLLPKEITRYGKVEIRHRARGAEYDRARLDESTSLEF
jgi:hypothetical protein